MITIKDLSFDSFLVFVCGCKCEMPISKLKIEQVEFSVNNFTVNGHKWDLDRALVNGNGKQDLEHLGN